MVGSLKIGVEEVLNLLILTDPLWNKDYTKIFEIIDDLGHNLIGFIALNGENDFGKIADYDVYPFAFTQILKYDLALIDGHIEGVQHIIQPLINAGIPQHKIKTIYWLLQQKMTKKYEHIEDQSIQETLEYWKTNELSVFNQYTRNYPHTYDEMHIDESCGLPYIIFKTVEDKEKRMYYPEGSGVKAPDGKSYIADVLSEQIPTSPHLYVKDDHKVDYGDVLIDAGVCEGNFALKYVDVCSKIYLFEMDKKWFAPLYYTFKDYWDKVEFIPKAVTNMAGGGGVVLDDAVSVPAGSKIFLKMDIEGAEIDALHGAKKILQSNRVKASICSYHRKDDCWKIKSLLQNYGYRTATSSGYMVFIWDANIWDTADFRKGIIYARNY